MDLLPLRYFQKVAEYEELMFEPVQKHHARFLGKAYEGNYPTAASIREFASKRAAYIPKMIEANIPD